MTEATERLQTLCDAHMWRSPRREDVRAVLNENKELSRRTGWLAFLSGLALGAIIAALIVLGSVA
jgi:hypothetical protein